MNGFEKMDIMSKRNMDIRVSNTLVEAKKVKAGGHVTMGVDEKTLFDIAINDSVYLALYVVDKKQFDAVANEDDPYFVKSMPQAMHVLTCQLRRDEELREAWKANIAMAFQDTFWQYVEPKGGPAILVDHSKERIHEIANYAADQFLRNLTRTEAGN